MTLVRPDSTLINIVAKASTLHERLAGQLVLDVTRHHPAQNEQRINNRLQKWMDSAAKGDPAKFARRLAWDDLKIEDVRVWLGDIRWPNGDPLPEWADLLAEVLAETVIAPMVGNRALFDTRLPIPFEDVFAPFVAVARRKAFDGTPPDRLSRMAQLALEHHLVHELSVVGRRCLYVEFAKLRNREQPLAMLGLGGTSDGYGASRTLYERFVGSLLGSGLLDFFETYPVLAKLLTTLTLDWIATTAELINAVENDLAKIQSSFGNTGGQIIALEPGLSDPHCGRRSVALVTFSSGLKLIYKPRSVGIEQAYQMFVEWLNGKGLSVPLKSLTVINCGTHGWIEYVTHQECTDTAAIERYFWRAGMLVGLIYALRGTDFHYENLIAHGEFPIPVDLELLMTPRLSIDPQPDGGVLATDLLPRWTTKPDGTRVDVSAFGSYLHENQTILREQWHHINSDGMDYSYEPVALTTLNDVNVPMLNDRGVSSQPFVENIVGGFQEIYEVLFGWRHEVQAEDGPLAHFRKQKIRFILRKSPLYSALLAASQHPDLMRDGADHSIQLEALCRLYLADSAPLNDVGKHPLWKLLATERRALEQLDIPIFTLDASDNALENGLVTDCFASSGFERVMTTLYMFGDADREAQIVAIRTAFAG